LNTFGQDGESPLAVPCRITFQHPRNAVISGAVSQMLAGGRRDPRASRAVFVSPRETPRPADRGHTWRSGSPHDPLELLLRLQVSYMYQTL
jgi:hypothetical protein